MKPRVWRFRPRWWGFLLAVCGCAAGIALGQWQSGRASERRAAMAEIEAAARATVVELPKGEFDARPLVRRRVAATGELLPQYTILLDYRMYRGRPGYHVVQPLRLTGSDRHVLVLRGWVAAAPRRDEQPAIVTPRGEQRVEGLALEQLPQYLEPAADAACRPSPAPCVWQNLSREKFAAWAGIAVGPLLIEQASSLPDGLARDWERAEAGYIKNEMYALQWYSLAALSVVLFLVLSVRRDARSDERSAS